MNPKNGKSFAMQFASFWDTGIGAALGPDATFALMALAKFMDKDDFSCWPSERTLAKMMGVSENTTRTYLNKLTKARFLDGEPFVRREKRPTGRPGQSKYKYFISPRLQVSHGADPAPVDPALVPKPAKSEANIRNVAKARHVANAGKGSETTPGPGPTD